LVDATRDFPTRWAGYAKAALAVVVTVACVWAIARALEGQSLASVSAAFAAIPLAKTLIAICLMLILFGVMSVMEALAMHDAGVRVSLRRTILSACVGNALSIAAGLGPVSAAAVRTGLFRRWGVGVHAAAVTALGGTVMSLSGGATLAALGLVFGPDTMSEASHLPRALLQGIGAAFLAGVGALVLASDRFARPIRLFGAEIRFPDARGALARIGLGALDWWISANVFYAFITPALDWAPMRFVASFSAAHFVGMAAGAPAGLGVFDALMLHVQGAETPASSVAAALLMYRLVAQIAPAIIALGFFWNQRRKGIAAS
jgi:phosphatidylglycerol lysyltransferase